jgi:hypothetical protein
VNYYWTDCPGCGCQVAINYTVSPARVSGSVRRWSGDRAINDGRPVEVAASELRPEGGFAVACVCGAEIEVPETPSAVSEGR